MARQVSDDAALDLLFPIPSQPPTYQAPARFPGSSPEMVATLQRRLKENHVQWHIFFNALRFHNHVAHQLLAIFQLGANGPLIDAAYEESIATQRKQFDSPGSITETNFHEHLGKEEYYRAYLLFFTQYLLDKGVAATLENYIFSAKANIELPPSGQTPMEMTNRFFSGLLHPLIHCGYGAEFGLLGMFAEALALTAVQRATVAIFTPCTLWQHAERVSSDLGIAFISRFANLLPSLDRPTQACKTLRTHALSLVSRILQDDDYSYQTLVLPPPEQSEDTALRRVIRLRGEALVSLIDSDWTVDGTDAHEVANKIEELFWTITAIFGVCGFWGRKNIDNGKFQGEFNIMHLVTSVLFLPSIVAYLSPKSINILLRTYLLNALTLYISRGRPPLPIAEFYDTVTPTPTPPAELTRKPADGTLTPENPTPNPWLAITQSAMMHPDDHLCKLLRSLAHFDSLYGTTPAGRLKELGVELEGAERLDGSLFVRTAGLVMSQMGWMREGEERKQWDFEGFYHD